MTYLVAAPRRILEFQTFHVLNEFGLVIVSKINICDSPVSIFKLSDLKIICMFILYKICCLFFCLESVERLFHPNKCINV